MEDKRCVNCSRVPVVDSTLCVDCLAACEIGRRDGSEEIERLKEKNRRQQGLFRVIFQETQKLIKAAGR